AGARLPHRPVLRRAVLGLVVAIGLTSTLLNSYYAWSFNQRARDWAASLAALPPAARVLQLAAATAPGYRMYPLGRLVNSYYNGDYFASMHVVTNGGFVSKAFYNGPARPRLDIDTFVYYLREFDDADYVVEECEATRGSYDAVLGWGPLEAALLAQLHACLGPGDRQGDLTFWKVR
ncbi:MAG: hypothetical protein H7Y32_13390, partial [Chloroflexales bacterium]|nr:hypothetical protein [Chloroflexales bacterium]